MARSGQQDFDFFHGKWRVRHRRLRERMAASNDWQEFDGVCICRCTLGGLGNFDDNIVDFTRGPVSRNDHTIF